MVNGGTHDKLKKEAELLESYSALFVAYRKEPGKELIEAFDDLVKQIKELDPHIKLAKPQTDKRFWQIRQQIEIYGARYINKYKRFKLYVASNAGMILIGLTASALLTLAAVGWYVGRKTNEYKLTLKAAQNEAANLKNALDTSNASLDSKIASAIAPLEARLEARINEIYTIVQETECKQEFLMNEYDMLVASAKATEKELEYSKETYKKLKNEFGENKDKIVSSLAKVTELEEKLKILTEEKVDKKKVEELKETVFDLKKTMDELRGKNYNP